MISFQDLRCSYCEAAVMKTVWHGPENRQVDRPAPWGRDLCEQGCVLRGIRVWIMLRCHTFETLNNF